MPLASDSRQVKCGTSGRLKRYFRTHQMGWLVGRGRCRCAAAPLFVQILPVVLGYRTNMAALGWKWESRLSIVTDLLTAATSPDANDANTAHCKAVAGHQGIEAEAISWQGLHYAAVDWCWVGAGSQRGEQPSIFGLYMQSALRWVSQRWAYYCGALLKFERISGKVQTPAGC